MTTYLKRTIPSTLLANLQSEVLQLAMCYKVTRADGTVFGFTTHDVDIILDSVLYEAFAAAQSSNIRQEAAGSPDNLDVMGVLSSDRISESDLRAGRYDDATVEIRLCDWSDPSAGSVILFRGNIGDVTVTNSMYTAAVRSQKQRYQQQVGELTSPMCRVFRLGDSRCKVNLGGNTVDGHAIQSNVTIGSVADQLAFVLSGGVTVAGFYTYGSLKSTGGLNNLIEREVKLHSASNVADSSTVVSSPSTATDIVYRVPTNYSPSQTFTFAIPAGVWDMATLSLTTTTTLRTAAVGTDSLTMQAPPGQANDVLVRTINAAGTYNDVLPLGSATLGAINAAAGGSFSIALRHTAPSPQNAPFMHLNITVFTLTLIGAVAGTTGRVLLHERFPFDVASGDTFVATAGCNRLPITCTNKFANIVNFRGEPNIPGVDRLLAVGRPPS